MSSWRIFIYWFSVTDHVHTFNFLLLEVFVNDSVMKCNIILKIEYFTSWPIVSNFVVTGNLVI